MNLVDIAAKELFPEFNYETSLNYSCKFKPYRANVRLRGGNIQFNLSKKWEGVGQDIQIGLVQELLLRIMRKRLKPMKGNTQNMELYNLFMKKIHLAAPKVRIDPVLEKSFDRVNHRHFYGLLDKTNLKWGSESLSKLGSYEYGSDTIVISRVLEEDYELLDYVMHHEMLHKKHKFRKGGVKSYHHTPAFKRDEKAFENSELMERRLKRLLVKKRLSFRNLLRGVF